jgi:uncharacterized phage-associated protein
MFPLDPRSVANTILSFAEEYGFVVTQLSLQKIIYFVHGRYIIENDEPLVSGHFEAWRYGPVHPLIYSSFKSFGEKPITGRATISDLMSAERRIVEEPSSAKIRLFIREAAARFLTMSPGRLVDLSHAPNSPWDNLTYISGEERQFGARISNDEIKARYKYHKISVGKMPNIGEPSEESPPS